MLSGNGLHAFCRWNKEKRVVGPDVNEICHPTKAEHWKKFGCRLLINNINPGKWHCVSRPSVAEIKRMGEKRIVVPGVNSLVLMSTRFLEFCHPIPFYENDDDEFFTCCVNRIANLYSPTPWLCWAVMNIWKQPSEVVFAPSFLSLAWLVKVWRRDGGFECGCCSCCCCCGLLSIRFVGGPC